MTTVDAQALEKALRAELEGEVRFDDASKALYSTDASNYRQVPIGVVIPKSKLDIIRTVALARKFGAPILSRGAGTSLAGQTCNVALVMDMSKYYNKILSIDANTRTARVQPGVVLDTLRAAATKQGLTFGPDPATHSHCTLGGMMGNNSCGVHAQMAGKTVDNTISLEILTYDGVQMEVGETSDAEFDRIIQEGGRRAEIYSELRKLRDRYAEEIRKRYPKIPRRVSGYNLDNLLPESGFNLAQALIGSESTLIVILEATLRLIKNPPHRALVLLGYPDVYSSADHVMEILAFSPIALEGLDEFLVTKMRKKKPTLPVQLLPGGKGWLYVEFGGETRQEAVSKAEQLMNALRKSSLVPDMKLYAEAAEQKEVWEMREGGLGATAFVPGGKDTWEGWDDTAVEPAKLGPYLRDLRKLYDKYGYEGGLYGHFGHGCIHSRITFDLYTAEGVEKFRAFLHEGADLVIAYGGSLSGEHGDGQARAELLPKMFGSELIKAFEGFKDIWDPAGKMNPGKIVRPYSPVDNLRLGPEYKPWEPAIHFTLPTDSGHMSHAALRCVGIGKCRKDEGGVMCPSYRVTREEMHSTRGRTHMLFELMRGDVLKDGWKNEQVKEALDLCLSCKGCKNDCPVNVDVATYKAEFLSHYYEGKLRPRSAYAFGWVYWWAKLGAKIPRLANFMTQSPVLSSIAKFVAGVAPQRAIPKIAEETFTSWFKKRASPPPSPSGRGRSAAAGEAGQVILWPDTFNNYFHPSVAKDAVTVLEHLGYGVILPPKPLCCGRPLYDYGFLGMAKDMLLQTLEALRPWIEEGVPLVGLEPSCVSVFRDEMTNLLGKDPLAQRLADQTFLLSEFLVKKAPSFSFPKLNRKALVQGHCHQRSVLSFGPDEELLKGLGLELSAPETGCCGMAGAFGFEKEHYDVSAACGERVLLPEARRAHSDTLFIANGFSCREQIQQGSGREPLHLAEVLALALRNTR